MKEEIKNPKIAFVLYSNVLWGSGLEKSALSYILYRPNDISKVIFAHSKIINGMKKRLDESVLNKIKEKSTIVEISNAYVKVEKIVVSMPIILRYIIYYPSLFILKLTVYRNLYKKIDKPDIIYVFRNDFSFFFNKNNFIVGSTHGWYPSNYKLLNKINKITSILFRENIKAYHTFPIWSQKVKEMFPNKKIIEVPNGIDTDKFKPIERNDNKIKFLFVARLEKCKGIINLIKIWEQFKDNDNLELDIVGSGTEEDYVKQKVIEMKNVIYHGTLNENDLQKIYGECDIFVYPSLCDSSPLVILEALSSGCHVITTKYFLNRFKEFEEFGAISFCNNDIKEFSNEIKKLINDFDKLRSEKETLHSIASKNYDIRIVVKSLYEAIIESYKI